MRHSPNRLPYNNLKPDCTLSIGLYNLCCTYCWIVYRLPHKNQCNTIKRFVEARRIDCSPSLQFSLHLYTAKHVLTYFNSILTHISRWQTKINDFTETHFTLSDEMHLLTGVKITDWICSFNLKVQNEHRTPLCSQQCMVQKKNSQHSVYAVK